MAILTFTDPCTHEAVNYFSLSGIGEVDGPIDDVIYKEISGVYYKRAFTGAVKVKWFGAKGDGITDDTNAIKRALHALNHKDDEDEPTPKYTSSVLEFEAGVYMVTDTLTITAGISLRGMGSAKKTDVYGFALDSSTIIRWARFPNDSELEPEPVILLLKNTSGITISGICFDTKSEHNPTLIYEYGNLPILIHGVTAIRYINRSSTRFNEIKDCFFHLLEVGIHYLDDGGDDTISSSSDEVSDFNMDTNFIDRCNFFACIIGVKVEQTNVYNALINRCSFYGSLTYTKHHLLIVKGHAEISNSYLGILRDGRPTPPPENLPMPKDGVAVEVNNGYCNLYNIYSESHNGPFFVWNNVLHEDINDPEEDHTDDEICTSNLISCNVAANTSSMPTDYGVQNRTSKTLNITGGAYTYWFSQKIGSKGSIVITGTDNVHVSNNSEPNRVFFFGNKFGNIPVAGSLPNLGNSSGGGTPKNGGKLYIVGETAEIDLTQVTETIFRSMVLKFTNNSLVVSIPGFYNGIEFDFENKKLKMPGWDIETT